MEWGMGRKGAQASHGLGGFKASDFLLGNLKRVSVEIDAPLNFAGEVKLKVVVAATFFETGHRTGSILESFVPGKSLIFCFTL
jgi:hypothetical protein